MKPLVNGYPFTAVAIIAQESTTSLCMSPTRVRTGQALRNFPAFIK